MFDLALRRGRREESQGQAKRLGGALLGLRGGGVLLHPRELWQHYAVSTEPVPGFHSIRSAAIQRRLPFPLNAPGMLCLKTSASKPRAFSRSYWLAVSVIALTAVTCESKKSRLRVLPCAGE